jgi:hypothetical protein
LQSAVSNVQNDIGEYNSVGSALTALYAGLPDTIREKVIDSIGNVKTVTDLPDAMQSLQEQIIVSGQKDSQESITPPKVPEKPKPIRWRRR